MFSIGHFVADRWSTLKDDIHAWKSIMAQSTSELEKAQCLLQSVNAKKGVAVDCSAGLNVLFC